MREGQRPATLITLHLESGVLREPVLLLPPGSGTRRPELEAGWAVVELTASGGILAVRGQARLFAGENGSYAQGNGWRLRIGGSGAISTNSALGNPRVDTVHDVVDTMPILELVRDGGQPDSRLTVMKLRGRTEWVIGREPGPNGVALRDPMVSRRHLRLMLLGDRIHLEDLGSSTGTRVNSTPCSGITPLSHGDRIEIGRSEFTFLDPGRGRASAGWDETHSFQAIEMALRPTAPPSPARGRLNKRAVGIALLLIGVLGLLIWLALPLLINNTRSVDASAPPQTPDPAE